VLFCDNLESQTTQSFKDLLKKTNTELHLLPTGKRPSVHTDQRASTGTPN
jgi:hypothetical protein